MGRKGYGGEEEDEKEKGRWIDGPRSIHRLGVPAEDPNTRWDLC